MEESIYWFKDSRDVILTAPWLRSLRASVLWLRKACAIRA